MARLVHKHIPDVTIVVTDEVAESMRGSWDVAPEPKAKAKSDSKK